MKSIPQEPTEHRHRRPAFPFMVMDPDGDILLVLRPYQPTQKENALVLYSKDGSSVVGVDRPVDLSVTEYETLPPGYEVTLRQE